MEFPETDSDEESLIKGGKDVGEWYVSPRTGIDANTSRLGNRDLG